MNIIVCICSKYPNPVLYECISSLYNNQINSKYNNNHFNYKICVVDSDSTDFSYYDKIKLDFPEVELLFTKNINYEYGAYNCVRNTYPNYDIYFCIQDSIIINKYIDISKIDDSTAYIHDHHSGYYSYNQYGKDLGIQYLSDSGLDYTTIIDMPFNLAQHNLFIISNLVIHDMFTKLKHPPVNKDGSCTYERIFGIYFILQKMNTINFSDCITKYHCSLSHSRK